MIEQLFGSKTRVKLLHLFFENPNRSFYVREITRKIDEQINSVRRELANLLNIGIITSDSSNNKVYYEVNQKYAYYLALQEIFGGIKPRKTRKTKPATKASAQPDEAAATAPSVEMTSELMELEEPAELKQLGNVEVAALMGQFTRDETSGVDVLIVGNVNRNALQKYVTELEEQEGKELRYTVFSLEEFRYRAQIKDRFVSNVQDSKKQVLLDKPGLLR
ncbi:transcriptional regulator [Candidatus Saccharibacteria bacterium]|nr:MAG: transcriptional regulator [Candidatus Saccharibacteria bacterium]PID98869.1 MAG: transcriptional regulator [Candidatus Saccharibacteria bacterium]